METLIIDTRQKKGKHNLKHSFFEGLEDVEIVEHALKVGDYMLVGCPLCLDTKANIQELKQDIQSKDHERFVKELQKAKDAGIKLIILTETEHVSSLEELAKWREPNNEYYRRGGRRCSKTYKDNGKKSPKGRPRRIYGKPLAKACETMQEKYGCEFYFCTPKVAGSFIIDALMSEPADEKMTFDYITKQAKVDEFDEAFEFEETTEQPEVEQPEVEANFENLLDTFFGTEEGRHNDA